MVYLWMLVIFLGFPYVLGPVVIWFTFRLRAYANYDVIDPAALPDDVRRYFESLAPGLVRDGFVAACYVNNTGATRGVQGYIAAWMNAERGQTASAIAIVPTLGTKQFSLAFGTATAPNGRTVVTTNYGADAGVFEQRDWLDTARVPWASDPRELYQVHLNRERRLLPPDAVRYLPEPAHVPAAFAEHAAFEVREQVRAGLMRETSRAGEVGVTWRGAWLVVMRLLPPLKQIRLRQARRRARGDYEDALRSPAPPPVAVRVTHESPFVQPESRFPLNYA